MRKFKNENSNLKIKDETDIKRIEEQFSILFPKELVEFLLSYEGYRLDDSESYFKTNDGTYEVNKILFLRKDELHASIEAIYEGHLFYGVNGYIPFAIDSGGWDFSVSINPENYGQVWVNKFDNGEEETMFFVANSLEEFIEGLKSEDEIEL